MDKIIFIVPYYGKWPSFFREWVYTAGYLEKQNIDFLLVTDLGINFKLPGNIFVKNMSFSELKKQIQSYFDFPISLETPYKLCDFRPAFGMIFNDDIQEYLFWGHCDVDLFWGNVRKFITDEVLKSYDKIQYLGHFVLYRNCKRMNELFKLPGAIYDYRHVFSSPLSYSFDEHPGMMQIVVKNGISNFVATNQADISPRYTRVYISRVENYEHQILYWNKGTVLRKYIANDGNICADEFMYAHFQRKNPKGLTKWDENKNPESFLYKADGFQYINPQEITKEYIIKKSDFVSDRIDKEKNRNYKLKKIKEFIMCSTERKEIWLKQRKATKSLKKYTNYFGE